MAAPRATSRPASSGAISTGMVMNISRAPLSPGEEP